MLIISILFLPLFPNGSVISPSPREGTTGAIRENFLEEVGQGVEISEVGGEERGSAVRGFQLFGGSEAAD